MLRRLFKVVGLAALLFCCLCTGFAQDQGASDKPDRVKLSVAFSNSEYSDLFSTEYAQGLTAELDARMFRKSGFRLGGVFQWNRANIGDPVHLDTYSFGPQLSVDLFGGHVAAFGRALFGIQTTYQADRTFTRSYGFGADINLGHVFIRPVAFDYKKFEGVQGAVGQYSAGVGVRF